MMNRRSVMSALLGLIGLPFFSRKGSGKKKVEEGKNCMLLDKPLRDQVRDPIIGVYSSKRYNSISKRHDNTRI